MMIDLIELISNKIKCHFNICQMAQKCDPLSISDENDDLFANLQSFLIFKMEKKLNGE